MCPLSEQRCTARSPNEITRREHNLSPPASGPHHPLPPVRHRIDLGDGAAADDSRSCATPAACRRAAVRSWWLPAFRCPRRGFGELVEPKRPARECCRRHGSARGVLSPRRRPARDSRTDGPPFKTPRSSPAPFGMSPVDPLRSICGRDVQPSSASVVPGGPPGLAHLQRWHGQCRWSEAAPSLP